MSQEKVEALRVIVETNDGKKLVFENPDLQKVTMQGQATFQLSGSYVEEIQDAKITILEDDIVMVSEQAGVSKEDARKALEKANGDIAQAIVDLG